MNITTRHTCDTLLGPDDPQPVEILNQNSTIPIVLTCEHAGRAIPDTLENLHLPDESFGSHIAYDIGAEGLATQLAHQLGAPLVLQRYSRLVIDCNRPFEATDCIAPVSDGTHIPGNQGLRRVERERRFAEIHEPYHRAISALLDTRCENPVALVSIHSFTPCMNEVERPWHAGLLFNGDGRMAKHMMQLLKQDNLNIAYNQPYSVDDLSDYTIPVHGEGRNIPHILIEVRNDELDNDDGQEQWAGYIGTALKTIASRLSEIMVTPVR